VSPGVGKLNRRQNDNGGAVSRTGGSPEVSQKRNGSTEVKPRHRIMAFFRITDFAIPSVFGTVLADYLFPAVSDNS
jgi:hypothetical protein